MISDQRAQHIASDWHGGGGSPLYQFSSTGAIVPGVLVEVAQAVAAALFEVSEQDGTTSDIYALYDLRAYLKASGERGPVADWYARVICAE